MIYLCEEIRATVEFTRVHSTKEFSRPNELYNELRHTHTYKSIYIHITFLTTVHIEVS